MAKTRILRVFFIATMAGALLTGCQALKPASQASVQADRAARPAFLSNISTTTTSAPVNNARVQETMPEIRDESYVPAFYFNRAFDIEQSRHSQFRYAILMNVEVEELSNEALYQYIDNWLGTPYRMGGNTRSGIDCSAFVQGLLVSVYGVSIPRVAREQKASCVPVNSDSLQEGDLVFFNTRGGVSHVGVYLHNGWFAHASTSGGVTVSHLEETYWQRRFLGAGRPAADPAEVYNTISGQ